MGIISKIKSMLGLPSVDHERPDEPGTTVTVEREVDAGSERAVKEPTGGPETRSAAEADADVEAGEAAPEAAAEPPAGDAVAEEPVEEEPAAEEPAEEAPAAEEPEGGAEPVEAIKGIGAAYAERLAGADVLTVADLAEADAGDVAVETDIAEGRIENWIERAKARLR